MKNQNYYVIQGWMVNELNLSDNQLIIYAVIYEFIQDKENYYEGSLNYLAGCINASRSTVQKVLKELINKELLEKESTTFNGITFTKYKANTSIGGTENR